MKRHATAIGGFIIATVFCASVQTAAQDKKITRKDVPAAVISAFTKAYPDARMRGFSTETEKGTLYYEIESVRGKSTIDALLLPDGTFYEVEEGMPAKDLPAAVSGAVTAKYPKAKIQKVEKTTRGAEVTYDLSVKAGTSRLSVTVDPAGKILKETKAGVKEEEEKEK